MQDMKPIFRVDIPCHHWIGTPGCKGGGKLSTPQVGLEEGLRIWRRLRDARGRVFIGKASLLSYVGPLELERTWLQLRSAYLEVVGELGRDAQACSQRLQRLYEAQQQTRELSMQRWNQSRMATEERFQRLAARREAAVQHRERERMAFEDRQSRNTIVRIERRERSHMAKEERRQRLAERSWARGLERERRAMARADRAARRLQHTISVQERAAQRAARRVRWLLAKWARKEYMALRRASNAKARLQAAVAVEQAREARLRATSRRRELERLREEQRRERQQAEERWRRLTRKDLTMADILHQ